jgi:serine/threonine-protein phosphatase PP1 catalytic subunit
MCSFQILKPAEKRQRFSYQGGGQNRPGTPQGQAAGGRS